MNDFSSLFFLGTLSNSASKASLNLVVEITICLSSTLLTPSSSISFKVFVPVIVYSSKLIANKDLLLAPPNETSPSKFSPVTYQVGAFNVFQQTTATVPLLA